MLTQDPTQWSLTDAATALRARRVSSRELTRACLDRIAREQPRLNAFIAITEDSALAAADQADAMLAAGAPGALLGVPLAHKDMFYRRGTISTCGSAIRRDFVPDTTATVLERLDATGAVSLGRLNMAEFAMGATGHNAHFGPARNPHDTTRITGGSSSGSGAAVAAHLVFGALGSDTGGSVRLPAGMCGIAGLKPTQGRVSRAGVMGLSFSLDNVGPLARTVADVALMFGIIAGADPADPTCSTRPVVAPDLDAGLRGLRIGVPAALDTAVDPQVTAAMEAARCALQDQGAELREVTLPSLGALADLGTVISMTEGAALHADWLRERPQDYGAAIRARLYQGLAIPGVTYLRALQLRAGAVRAMLDAFAGCDMVQLPLLPCPVPTLAETDFDSGPEAVALIARLAGLTRPINYVGLPALTLQAGRNSAGMPIAMQLVGRPFDEATLLRAGHAFQSAA